MIKKKQFWNLIQVLDYWCVRMFMCLKFLKKTNLLTFFGT